MSSKMKSPLVLGATLVGSFLLSGAALAEGSCGAKHDQKMADKSMAEGKCGVANLDTNKDGKVSKDEYWTAHKEDKTGFASRDANKDGFLTADEFEMKKGS